MSLDLRTALRERCFLTLRRVKYWLRVSLGKERLIGLALLKLHKNIDIDVEAVIDRFFKILRDQIEICTVVQKKKFL